MGYLTSLAGLPGRFVNVEYRDGMIQVEVSDAEGNVTGSMSWAYSEPEVVPAPEPDPVVGDGAQ